MKRLLSTLLAFALAFTMLPSAALATAETDQMRESASAPEDELVLDQGSEDSGVEADGNQSVALESEDEALVDEVADVSEQEEASSESPLSAQTSKAKRTILLYDCGTDLETDAAMATYNLRQILKSRFSANDDVRFIIMTGGADKWHLEKDYLVFPDNVDVPNDAVSKKGPNDPTDPGAPYGEPKSQISNVYNQIWEAKGVDAAQNPGKMVLVDGDGVLGDGESAKRSMIKAEDYSYSSGFDLSKEGDYEWMNEPEVLKAFINYGVEHFPAEKYDLILWDHGGGPAGGFCSNQQEAFHGYNDMSLAELLDAFSHNKVVDSDGDGVQDGKFDFIDFDACLMGNVETLLVLGDYMEYYIASPETEPGYGQYYGPCEGQYTGWLDELGKNADMSAYELGKIIVDDFVTFYNKESGDGSSQEGTLAVFNVNELLTQRVDGKTFAESLDDLSNTLATNLKSGSYYDEFRSFNNSIDYSEMKYFDFGILLTQLAYAFDDISYQDLQSGTIDDTNLYTEIAKSLMGFVYNEDFVYARSTRGIHTDEQFYRDANGQMQYGALGTSGLHVWFDPRENPEDVFFTYHVPMRKTIKKLEEQETNKAKAALLKNYLRAAELYGIVYHTGAAVSQMVSDGVDKESIDYEAVMQHLMGIEDLANGGTMYDSLQRYVNSVGGSSEVEGWLKGLINQMKIEAVQKSNILVEPETTSAGTGYTITLNDIRKQAISDITLDVYAELPAAVEYLCDPEHAEYAARFARAETGLKVGTISGSEVIDVDPKTQGYEAAVDWLMDPTSTWKLDPPQTKWYALRDAEGNLHVTAAEAEERELEIPLGYSTMELRPSEYDDELNAIAYELQEVWHKVWLIFGKDASGAWTLSELAIQQDNGGYRLVSASEFEGEYELVPVMEVAAAYGAVLPISKTSLTLNNQTVGNIAVEYMDLSEIGGDVADTDGDGKICHHDVAVTNIYGYKLNITDVVKASTLSESEAAQAVEDAKAAVAEAKREVNALADDASAEEVKAAYDKLVKAQQALTEAQETLQNVRSRISKEEQARLKDEIDRLNDEITDLNDQLSAAQVVDISNYAATLEKDSYQYTGKAITPAVTVSGLRAGDYTVRYANNINVGTAAVTISASGGQFTGTITKTFTITKRANPLALKGKTAKVKYARLKKKNRALAVSKVITFKKKVDDTKTYKLASVNKGKKSFKKKYFKVNKKTGKVTVKKGLKKGTYKVKIKVKAAGNATYEAATKTVTCKVTVE